MGFIPDQFVFIDQFIPVSISVLETLIVNSCIVVPNTLINSFGSEAVIFLLNAKRNLATVASPQAIQMISIDW
jgi:hypothetical protein